MQETTEKSLGVRREGIQIVSRQVLDISILLTNFFMLIQT